MQVKDAKICIHEGILESAIYYILLSSSPYKHSPYKHSPYKHILLYLYTIEMIKSIQAQYIFSSTRPNLRHHVPMPHALQRKLV